MRLSWKIFLKIKNLYEKNVVDNKKYCQTVKLLLSDKSLSIEKTKGLTENKSTLISVSELVESLKKFIFKYSKEALNSKI